MRKRSRVIFLWLIWSITMSLIFYTVENRIIREKAREELLDQANIISEQLSVLAENHFCAEAGDTKAQNARLKALSLLLDHVETLEDARPLLDEFTESTDTDGLVVYDREGNILYTVGDAAGINVPADIVQILLDQHLFEIMDQALVWNDVYHDYLFSSQIFDDSDDYICWSAHQDQWLLAAHTRPSKAKAEVINYFDWRTVFRRIPIGKTGTLLAVDQTDETILSWEDRTLEGETLNALNLQLPGNAAAVSLEELKAAFSQPGQTQEVRIGGKAYLAARVDEERMLTLAFLPMDEIREDVFGATGVLALLTLFVTGVCAGYAFFHIRDEAETVWQEKKRFRRNRELSGKLKVVSVVAVLFVFFAGIFLEALSVYADTFSYSREKVTRVVELLEKNADAVAKLTQWYEDDDLARCRIAAFVLNHTEKEKITWDYLEELSARLGLRTVSAFDAQGRRLFSNSLRNQTVLPADSPFRSLLEGREALVAEPVMDEITGERLQTVGVALRNQDHTSGGMILIETDAREMETIRRNLGFQSVFEQISLSEDTCVLVIDDDDMIVAYVGEVDDGAFQNSLSDYDYVGLHASSLGIEENLLRDHYNGEMLLLENRYFASVRRTEGYYYLIMRPHVPVSGSRLIPALLTVAGTLAFMFLLFLASCVSRKTETPPNTERQQAAKEEGSEDGESDKAKRRDDDVLMMLSGIVNKKKPYFEERWPEDSIRWKDRTPEEKFSVFVKTVAMLALAAIVLHAVISGESSVWYYCVSGEWSSGINLYSITSCVISVCILLIIKLALHKLLFWIARAVNAKGETICHLLDSFSGYALAIVGVFECLASVGVNTTALSLTGGVLGVVFGIGCQNIVADILAGILMTFEGVVHAGDFVSFNGKYGVVLSIGVRTTRLKWFSEITVVRNNDFKNYINMPSEKTDRVTTTLAIDLSESLERVENILNEELPLIHENLCAISGENIGGPKYRGVSQITENSVVLSFAIFCKGMYYGWMFRTLNGELKRMCERRNIKLARPQVVVHEGDHMAPPTDT